MDLLNRIFAIIIYILFFSWIFLRIRNIVLVKKMDCKEIYKKMKKDIKKQKILKYLFRIIIISLIMFSIYLVIGLVSGALALFMMFITLGGIGYSDSGADPTFYNNLMSFVSNYFSLFKYAAYFLYIIIEMAFIRDIYINVRTYKDLSIDKK